MRFAEVGGTAASGSVGAGFFLDSRVLRENNRDDPENLLRKPENFNRRRALSERLLRVLTS